MEVRSRLQRFLRQLVCGALGPFRFVFSSPVLTGDEHRLRIIFESNRYPENENRLVRHPILVENGRNDALVAQHC